MVSEERPPVAALFVAAVALVLFAFLTLNVLLNWPLVALDQRWAAAIHQWALQQPGSFTAFVQFWGWLGREGIAFMAAALCMYWLFRREWQRFTLVVLGVAGAEAIFQIVSNLVNRPRPVFPQAIERLTVPGFPSGHTVSAVLMFGTIYCVFAPYLPSHNWRRVFLALCVAIMALIGLSRLYVGVHYPTDVLAGYVLGVAWGGLVYYGVWNYYGPPDIVRQPSAVTRGPSQRDPSQSRVKS